MVRLARVRHPLDDVVSMLGDIHFDATAHTNTSRPLRCLVDKLERMLQSRFVRRVCHAFDDESLLLHEYRRGGVNAVRKPLRRRQSLYQVADYRFQRSRRWVFVLNQITDGVSFRESEHRADLIHIATSCGKSLGNRSPCAECRHTLESRPCEDPAVDIQDDSAPVLPSAANCSHRYGHFVSVPGEK